jgi:hypothetical protein
MMLSALVVAASIVVVVALFVFSSSNSAPEQISFRGHTYGSMVKVTPIEVRAHVGTLRPAGTKIDGDAVFINSGTPPTVVALAVGGGDYDAYQLSG